MVGACHGCLVGSHSTGCRGSVTTPFEPQLAALSCGVCTTAQEASCSSLEFLPNQWQIFQSQSERCHTSCHVALMVPQELPTVLPYVV